MFQFPTFALGNGFLSRSVSRFGHPRLKCLRTANRGFSQLITSFVASQRQGIHRLLFVACSPHLHPNVTRTCSGGPDGAGGWLGRLPCGGCAGAPGVVGRPCSVVATRATALVLAWLRPFGWRLGGFERVHSFFIARQVFKEPLRASPDREGPGFVGLPWGFARLAPLRARPVAGPRLRRLVELRGFEPLTLGLQSRCSPS